MNILGHRSFIGLVVLTGTILGACTNSTPPTVTPAPEGQPGRSVEIPVNPPPGSTMQAAPLEIPPLNIEALTQYRDPDSRYSVLVPASWPADPQDVGGASGTDIKLGVLFASPEGNGLLTVTQFDNGQVPQNIGNLASQVLQMTGVTEQPGYLELDRSNVLTREGQALRVELEYERSDGTEMRSLVLFQADNTTFSMVNVSLARDSWQANEEQAYEILNSYQVPAAPLNTTP